MSVGVALVGYAAPVHEVDKQEWRAWFGVLRSGDVLIGPDQHQRAGIGGWGLVGEVGKHGQRDASLSGGMLEPGCVHRAVQLQQRVVGPERVVATSPRWPARCGGVGSRALWRA